MTVAQTDERDITEYSGCKSCLRAHSMVSNSDGRVPVWDEPRVGGGAGQCVRTGRYSLRAVKRYLTVILIAYGVMGAQAGSYRRATDWYQQQEDAMVKYLGDYGYIQDASRETGPAGLMSKEAFHAAIKRLQRMGNIPETGVVDQRTLELMKKPRCGVKDDMESSSRRRRKRYVVAPSKWEKHDLTFRIINTTPDMRKADVRRAITDAFRVWSEVTALTFTETINSDADILIQFAEHYHHDGYPFDGKGSVLAHAFFPGDDRGGDTHFDDGETWTLNSTEGVDLFMVAAHEFGHALGLAHSSNTEALMYPWYQGFQNNFRLPYDDVQGIQSLYGSKDRRLPVVTPRPRPPRPQTPKPGSVTNRPPRPPYKPQVPDKDINPCEHSIDAITVIRTEIFVFIGDMFWRIGTNGLRGAPTKQSMFWYDIPEGGIDAVYERSDGKIVFFKGDRFWVYNSNYLVANFPKSGKPITELGIDKEVKKIDAVFVWGYNKRTYLVTGDMYWKLNVKDDNVEFDYPRDMSIWRNVPLPLDSAFKLWDGKTYFLQGDQFWEFYDNKMRTKKRTGRPLSRLLGCKEHKGKRLLNPTIINSDNQLSEITEPGPADPSSAARMHIVIANLICLVVGIKYLH